jgi:hypothetical protein
MRRIIINFITSLLCLFIISGCSPWYGIKNQSSLIPNFEKYKTIYVGWIDLGKNEWHKFGYVNQNDWISAINSLNRDSFSYYFRQFEPKRNIIAPNNENEKIPDNAELIIKFTDSKYYQFGNTDGKTIYMAEGLKAKEDIIETTIHFIDKETNKELYNVMITVEATISLNSYTFSLEGRINNASYNIARFISQKVLRNKK